MIAGEPWFVAIDACRSIALEVGAGGVARFVKALDPDEKRVIRKVPAWKRVIEKADDPYAALFGEFDSILTLISEPGLYKLIQRSNKPEAKLFDRWVRHEVLPSIRKTGGYLLNESKRATAHADTKDEMPMMAQLLAQVASLTDVVASLQEQLKASGVVQSVAKKPRKTAVYRTMPIRPHHCSPPVRYT